MQTEKINIWLDCDVGNDDAMAIILASQDPKCNLLGVSSCFGNTCIENSTNNTLKVLSSIGCEHIPVFKGAAFSSKANRAATTIHGSQGLFGAEKLIKTFDIVKDITLFDLIKKQVGNQKFTIVITGPQTNIVMLLQQHPEIIPQLNEIVFMGGTSGFGNVTPNAEYNIYSDPEAAQEMIELCNKNKIKLVMISLDLTYTCLVVEAQQRRMKEINTKFSDWCLQVIQEFQEAYKEEEGFDYPPLHDPLAICYALYPEFYNTQPTYVIVECESTLCYGRTIIDKNNQYRKKPTLEFAKKLDVDRFWDHMIGAIRQASSNSKIESLDQI